MSDYNASDHLRRIERAEERLSDADRELARLGAEVHSLHEEFHRRITELKTDLIAKGDDNKQAFAERVESLRKDINDNIDAVSSTMRVLNDTVTQTTESLQNLRLTQNKNTVRVNTNEKITWGIIGIVTTGALYLLQEFFKGGFGGG